MPESRNRSAAGFKILGLRATTRATYVRRLQDPRITFCEDLISQQKKRLNAASPVVIEAQRLIDDIDSGADIEVPVWYAAGNSHPEGYACPWIGSVSTVIVNARDEIRRGQPARTVAGT